MHNKSFSRRGYSGGLWYACRKALLACLTIFSISLPLPAQKYPNNLATDSVSPKEDAESIRQIRARLNRIKKTEKRPTVALVLAGGGAKGASQVGVIQCIMDKGIPIDFVCGTSIGGLLGGLLSVGYEPKDMLELFTTSDWGYILSDRIPQDYFSYDTKMYRSKYIVRIPFHYEDSDFNNRVLEGERYTSGKADFKLTSPRADISTAKGVSNIASSLPSGFAYGFNVGNLLSSLTVGYHDSLSFHKLPIPYMCVAADVVSGKAKNWGSGRLKLAMRSTMSIPGLFDPVRTDGMVLVDGGVRNNFPTDIARAVGADIIIGIDLANSDPTYTQVNNIADVAGQLISMLRKEVYIKTVENVDVFVKPDVSGFGMLSFNKDAIDTLFQRGYDAAKAASPQLDSIKALIPSYKQRPARKAVNINKKAVFVDRIEFSGLEDYESLLLMGKIGLKAGTYLDAAIINDAMCKLQATGAFESVSYLLLGSQEPYRLVFSCVKAPTHRFGLGLRMDTETWASVLLNAGFNVNKLKGVKFDIEALVGVNQKIGAKAYLDIPFVPTMVLSANFANVSNEIRYPFDNVRHNISYVFHSESFHLSWVSSQRVDFQTGVKNKYFNLGNTSYASNVVGTTSADYVGAFASATFYGLDDKFFPTKGLSVSVKDDFDFAHAGTKHFKPINALAMDFKWALPIGRRFCVITDFHLRNVYDRYSNYSQMLEPAVMPNGNYYNNEYSIFHRNYVGGEIAGRYIDQQIPFVGYNGIVGYFGEDTRMDENGEFILTMTSMDHIAVLNLDFRFALNKNLYLSAQGGYIKAATNFRDMVKELSPNIWGAALQLSYKTVVGPVKLRGFWSDRYGKFADGLGVSLSCGFDF